MSLLLLAALAAAPAAAQNPKPLSTAKPYGILLLAYDVDRDWRKELGSLRVALKGTPVETVESAADAASLQRAVDRLAAQHVAKIVAVPVETLSEAPWLDQVRYLFGVRAEPASDRPSSKSGDIADRPAKALTAPHPSNLVLPSRNAKRLQSPVPLVLTMTLDKSPLLVDILADRAKALAQNPSREALVLIAIAPRSDDALKGWNASSGEIARKVGEKAGFREAISIGVREGVRAGQQDADRAALRAALRALGRKGRVTVVPLAPQGDRAKQMLARELGGFVAYRWNGKGIQGDRRVVDWIRQTAEQASSLPDSRQYKDGAANNPGGFR